MITQTYLSEGRARPWFFQCNALTLRSVWKMDSLPCVWSLFWPKVYEDNLSRVYHSLHKESPKSSHSLLVYKMVKLVHKETQIAWKWMFFMWEQVNSKILLTRFFKVTSNVTFLVPPLSQQCLLHILDLLQGDLNVHAQCLKTSLIFIHERSFIHIWFYPPSICPYLDFTCLADTNV